MTRAHQHKQIISTKGRNKLLDKLIYVAAIVEPLFLFPQGVELFKHKDASSVYIPTWVGINLLITIWIWYAIINRQKVLLLYQALFFVANVLIIAGGILYGGKWW